MIKPDQRPVTGKWLEELTPGLVIHHAIRRTITESDNVMFTSMTMNPAWLHLDFDYAENETEFGKPLVNSMLTVAMVVGISVHETTLGTTVANLGFCRDRVSCTDVPRRHTPGRDRSAVQPSVLVQTEPGCRRVRTSRVQPTRHVDLSNRPVCIDAPGTRNRGGERSVKGPIVTLTLNPALDISSSVEVVAPMDKLRCAAPTTEPGGGGINVSRVCQRLGADTVAIAAVGGAGGDRFGRLLADEMIPFVALPIDGETRDSFTVIETSTGQQYRFVFPGPEIDADQLVRAGQLMAEVATNSPVAVMSGSMPKFPAGSIQQLIGMLGETKVIIDTSGAALVDALGSSAAVVKPSARELASVVGRHLGDERAIEAAAREILAESQVGALLVSIGAGGAFLCTADDVVRFRAPSVQVRERGRCR